MRGTLPITSKMAWQGDDRNQSAPPTCKVPGGYRDAHAVIDKPIFDNGGPGLACGYIIKPLQLHHIPFLVSQKASK